MAAVSSPGHGSLAPHVSCSHLDLPAWAQAGNVLCASVLWRKEWFARWRARLIGIWSLPKCHFRRHTTQNQNSSKPLECIKARFLRFQFAGCADSLLTVQHLDNGEFEENQNTSFLCTPGSENLTTVIELRPAIQCIPKSSTGM